MFLEDGPLKVVDELVAPGVYGLAHDVAAAFLWLSWGDFGIGSCCGNGYGWLYDDEPIASEVVPGRVYGCELLADAGGKRGLGGDEEGAVGSEPGSLAFHLGYSEVKAEALVEQPYHEGGI